jgi:hypothetical protein
MAVTIKKSNTTRIFEKNNFGKFLPILSNENLIERLVNTKTQDEDIKKVNSFLNQKRIPIGQGDNKIEPALISQLLQSVTTYGKYTNEILNEIKNVQGLKNSFKIIYISPDKFKEISKNDLIPDALSDIDISKMFYADINGNILDDEITKNKISTDNINNVNDILSIDVDEKNNFPYVRTKQNPGLSAIQVLNPEFRGCFKNSQELDLFFNMISTLDMSLAIPYVNAEFLIPQKVTRSTAEAGSTTNTNSRSYLTASLNNFILGDNYFIKDEKGNSDYDNVLSTAKAINGDYYTDEYTVIKNSVRTSSTENQTQVKKTYNRQSLNNAIFFAPQTMVNGDYNIADNPNAMVDKFRPFMTINNLSFDVRPTKGLLFYKTATMELVLYDKARMSQIAPFIKPELLNTVSSEIILEYGWQSNLGDPDYAKTTVVNIGGQDIQYSENPIAEFINSLKVREKYIIVNSSYTINQTGTVNISLSLAMKGPAELRGLSFRQNIELSKVQASLKDFINDINQVADKFTVNNVAVSQERDVNGAVTSSVQTSSQTQGLPELKKVTKDLDIDNIDAGDLQNIKNTVTNISKSGLDTGGTALMKELLDRIKIAEDNLKKLAEEKKTDTQENFPFYLTHDAKRNDPFVDQKWWDENLGEIENVDDKRDASVIKQKPGNWKGTEWISLGKLILSIIGKRLVLQDKKYDEIQFVFYTLNGKAVQASFLNIASIPVDIKLFKRRLDRLISNAIRLSYEGILEFILNFAVNQKAAAVFGLGKYFKFNDNNSTTVNIDGFDTIKDDTQRKTALNNQAKSVKSEIFRQYYGDSKPEIGKDGKTVFQNQDLQELNEIYGGVFDLTFNVPKVVMNFDSTFHENDPNSSILRISFYDELDNPFESVTELMLNFHKKSYNTAISGITGLRAKINKVKSAQANLNSSQSNTAAAEENSTKKVKETVKENPKGKSSEVTKDTTPVDQKTNEQVPTANQQKQIIDNVNEIIKRDTADVIYDLIQKKLIILKDDKGAEIPIEQIPSTNPLSVTNLKIIAINIQNSKTVDSFTNMKSAFKNYMPSLTFGQSNSALLSGNITTNQDAKYSTVLLMQQNSEEAEKQPTAYDFELFNQMNNSPMWVIPSQASAQIIGCPIVNFSQLIFLDFNTGTSIDNMYFINGIKHSISPGKFTTDLTLVQKDIYSQFESEASAIAEFFTAVKKFDDFQSQQKKVNELLQKESTRKTVKVNQAQSESATTNSTSTFQINFVINPEVK